MKKFWTDGFGSLLIAAILALIIRWALVEAYVIPTGSMLPSLLINDHIFINKIVYGLRVPFGTDWIFKFSEPKRGDVIVFRFPEDPSVFYVKRVVGMPGDHILYENGELSINNEIIPKLAPKEVVSEYDWVKDEHFLGEGPDAKNNFIHWQENLGVSKHSILLKSDEQANVSYGPYEVPQDHFFVLGDNRDRSQDSRFWERGKQFVPRNYLIGRAMIVWLSCEETFSSLPAICNPLTLRWNRFFYSVK